MILAVVVVALVVWWVAGSDDRQRLEILRSDPMARYRPPTGELITSAEDTGGWLYTFDHGWTENSSLVVSRWRITAKPDEISDDVRDALVQSGWANVSKSEVGNGVLLRAHKPQNGYCIAAFVLISSSVGGRVDLELTAPYTGSDDDGCPDG